LKERFSPAVVLADAGAKGKQAYHLAVPAFFFSAQQMFFVLAAAQLLPSANQGGRKCLLMYEGYGEVRRRKYAGAFAADIFASQTLVTPCNNPALQNQTYGRLSINTCQSMRQEKSQECYISCSNNSCFGGSQIIA